MRAILLAAILLRGVCVQAADDGLAERIAQSPLHAGKPVLSRVDVAADASFLAETMKKVYAGRFSMSSSAWDEELGRIAGLGSGLGSEVPVERFCDSLAEALAVFPDRHLEVKRGEKRCGRRSARPPWHVGENMARGRGKVWDLDLRKVGSYDVAVLAISHFESDADPRWRGLETNLERLLPRTHALVIDLRGNSGGDGGIGLRIARRLYGGEPPSPVLEDRMIESPETAAMGILEARLDIDKAKTTGAPTEHIEQSLAKQRERFARILAESKRTITSVPPKPGVPWDPARGYARAIAILQDSACSSACEGMIEAFEAHPLARTFGGPTAGAVHVRNVASLILPRSGLIVRLGRTYRVFKDGRQVEGTGFAPKYPVPAGSDALEAALSTLTPILAQTGAPRAGFSRAGGSRTETAAVPRRGASGASRDEENPICPGGCTPGLACMNTAPGRPAQCLPVFKKAQLPGLILPFEPGVEIFCSHGTGVGSHSYPNTFFALDLASRYSEAAPVVRAAEAGKAFVFLGEGGRPCPEPPGNAAHAQHDKCGGAWGNHVSVLHKGGYYSFYVHLDRVLVSDGQTVQKGQPIGVMGWTGGAGHRHLHWSVHALTARTAAEQAMQLKGGGRSVPFSFKAELDGAVQDVDAGALRCFHAPLDKAPPGSQPRLRAVE